MQQPTQSKIIFFFLLWGLLVGCGLFKSDEWIYAQTPIPPTDQREGKPLVIVVGDSIAAGWLECNPDPCAGIETDWWQSAIGEWAWVLNRGVGNSTTDDLLARWNQDTESADILIILIGINDVYHVANPTETATQNLSEMHRRATQAGMLPIVSTLLPFNDPTNPQRYADVDAINAFIRAQEGWMVLDLAEAFQDPQNPHQARPDELATTLHPNQQGYTRLAEYVRAWWQDTNLAD